MRLAILAIASALSASPSQAAEILTNFSGEPIWDKTEKNRVNHVSVIRDGDLLLLSFEAAARGGCAFPGSSGAWLSLQLTDDKGTGLGAYEQAAIASVNVKNGYQPHNDIEIQDKFNRARVAVASGYKLAMRGEAGCNK